jgi:hypothetical protein
VFGLREVGIVGREGILVEDQKTGCNKEELSSLSSDCEDEDS